MSKRISLPTSFAILYGCELETCFVLDCSTDEFNDQIIQSLKKIKESMNKDEKFNTWKDLIIFHIKTNLIPNFSKKFINRFPYAYIMGSHTKHGTYIDLKNGKILHTIKKIDNYNTIRFSQDLSVKCGDNKKEKDSLTVHCEIISPILQDISEIKLIYENIISETCNISNNSAGFHVNVSIVDTSNIKKTQIKLTLGILFEICKEWYLFEKKHYIEYRGEGSVYAKNISKMVNDTEFMKIIYEKKDGSFIEDSEILIPENEYGLRTLFAMEIINKKNTSLHVKREINVLEFRIFPSKNNIKELIDYTKKSISIVKKSMKNFIENYDIIYSEYNLLTSIYKKSKYFYFDPNNFEGPLSYYKKLNQVFYNRKDPLENFNEFETIIDKNFLLFFTEKEKMKGLQVGEHNYTSIDYNGNKKFFRIKYLPEEDVIQIKHINP